MKNPKVRNNPSMNCIMQFTGALTGLFSKLINNTLVRNYFSDAALSIFSYFTLKQVYLITGKEFKAKDRYIAGAVSFLTASAFEYGQKTELIGGVYDPKDYIAYAVGNVAAISLDYVIDKILTRKQLKRSNTE